MSPDSALQSLLQWRIARGAADAPPPPSAQRLLQLARPWWEVWPERLSARAERLVRFEGALGFAQSMPRTGHGAHAVPTIVVRTSAELETSARVLYIAVHDARLRLRLQLEGLPRESQQEVAVTFLAARSPEVLFAAPGITSRDAELSIEAELPAALADAWLLLRVSDEMPFRLVVEVDGERANDV